MRLMSHRVRYAHGLLEIILPNNRWTFDRRDHLQNKLFKPFSFLFNLNAVNLKMARQSSILWCTLQNRHLILLCLRYHVISKLFLRNKKPYLNLCNYHLITRKDILQEGWVDSGLFKKENKLTNFLKYWIIFFMDINLVNNHEKYYILSHALIRNELKSERKMR